MHSRKGPGCWNVVAVARALAVEAQVMAGGQLDALGRDVEDLEVSLADLPWPAAKEYYDEKNHRKSLVETSVLMMDG